MVLSIENVNPSNEIDKIIEKIDIEEFKAKFREFDKWKDDDELKLFLKESLKEFIKINYQGNATKFNDDSLKIFFLYCEHILMRDKLEQEKKEITEMVGKDFSYVEELKNDFFNLAKLEETEDAPFTKASYRNYKSFEKLTKAIQEELLENIKDKDKFTLLYPGGGSHFAPLETVFSVLDNSSVLVGELIYTDINETAYNNVKIYLDYLVKQGILIESDTAPEIVQLAKGEEKQLEFFYETQSGRKKIIFRYAIDASDTSQGDHPYYRQAYFDQADLVISHDSSDEITQDLYFLESFLQSAIQGGSMNKVFFFEESSGNSIMPDLLPGIVVKTTLPFGCAEDKEGNDIDHDHLGKAEDHAAAYVPDLKFWQSLEEDEFKAFFRFIASINSGSPYDDSGGIGRKIFYYYDEEIKKDVDVLLNLASKIENTYPEVRRDILEFLTSFIRASAKNDILETWFKVVPADWTEEILSHLVQSKHSVNNVDINNLLRPYEGETPYYFNKRKDKVISFIMKVAVEKGSADLFHQFSDKFFSILKVEENRNKILVKIQELAEKQKKMISEMQARDKVLKEKFGVTIRRNEDFLIKGRSYPSPKDEKKGMNDELNKLYDEEGVYWPILSHLKMLVNYLDLAKEYAHPMLKIVVEDMLENF